MHLPHGCYSWVADGKVSSDSFLTTRHSTTRNQRQSSTCKARPKARFNALPNALGAETSRDGNIGVHHKNQPVHGKIGPLKIDR